MYVPFNVLVERNQRREIVYTGLLFFLVRELFCNILFYNNVQFEMM